jgi:4-alpha-glucanotransferase
MMDLSQRVSGILLHPTSLPGPFGIGTLGAQAYQFVDFLVEAGQSIWQILPLGPVGFGASPYSSFCSVAGNPLLINLGKLVEQGDLRSRELAAPPRGRADRVDYATLEAWKMPVLERAARRFLESASPARRVSFERFCQQHADWIDAYSLFMALKEHFERKAAAEKRKHALWNSYWDHDIAMGLPEAIERWRGVLEERIALHRVLQFYFFEQWLQLRRYANQQGIAILGDMPIFVALDSVDVWQSPELFQLDARRKQTYVAGVPPDYFSATGQRWGNPLYDWDAMRATDYAWWVRRFRSLLELVDVVRIDHFRGFAACWSIPADEPTAMHGRWIEVPGMELFGILRRELGQLPLLAEDLGVITPDVEALRDHFAFPGMRVLQVGFENIEIGNIHLPEHHEENCVVYTGTHDNNTTLAWFHSLPEHKQQAIADYLGGELRRPAWELVQVAMASISRTAVIPMQDILELGESARMNRPSTTENNWQWRLTGDYAQGDLARRLGRLTAEHRRAVRW